MRSFARPRGLFAPGLRSALTVLAALFCTAAAASTAHAWTEAQVQSVSAHVDVDARGRAVVGMLVTVRIHGGWLEGLDVDGLDPNLELLAEKPPFAVSVDDPDLKWPLRVTLRDDGGVRLSFPPRGSPRRGTIRVGLAYVTSLREGGIVPLDDGRMRVSWTLPGWRSGLSGVEVSMSTPSDGAPAASMEDGSEAADEHASFDRDGVSVHVFRRIHLPRTVPWTVSVELPAEALDPSLHAPAVERPAIAARPIAPSGRSTLPLLLLVFFVAISSRLSFSLACHKAHLGARPLVPGPFWLVLPAMGGLAWAANHFAATAPLVSIICLALGTACALQRRPRRRDVASPTSNTGTAPLRHASGAVQAHAQRAVRSRLLGFSLTASPILDGTTVLGAALAAAAATAAVTLGSLMTEPTALAAVALGLALLPFATGTRFHLPMTPAARLLRLREVARALEAPLAAEAIDGPKVAAPLALDLVVRGEAAPSDPRLRIALARDEAQHGLLAIDLLVADVAVLGGYDSRLALLVTTRADSPAALAAGTPALELSEVPRSGETLGFVRSFGAGAGGDGIGRAIAELVGALDVAMANPIHRGASATSAKSTTSTTPASHSLAA